ncbi:hypothetical protein PGTUg99_031289 [Puccinia graminis f. sp. tritici]|uniref:Uncharacterized protein n=1 Tax=Puccinia graminis f. sp. tritici TaxID=56615 RepID=A0A5B0S7X3_PUCGR|nr:hypothetical protein PGTUg99_031289 [Puccinia graminis f. sp. tritici]
MYAGKPGKTSFGLDSAGQSDGGARSSSSLRWLRFVEPPLRDAGIKGDAFSSAPAEEQHPAPITHYLKLPLSDSKLASISLLLLLSPKPAALLTKNTRPHSYPRAHKEDYSQPPKFKAVPAIYQFSSSPASRLRNI